MFLLKKKISTRPSYFLTSPFFRGYYLSCRLPLQMSTRAATFLGDHQWIKLLTGLYRASKDFTSVFTWFVCIWGARDNWLLQVAQPVLPPLRISPGVLCSSRSSGQNQLYTSFPSAATTPSCLQLNSTQQKEAMLPLTPPPKSCHNSGGASSSRGENKEARTSCWVMLLQWARKEKGEGDG